MSDSAPTKTDQSSSAIGGGDVRSNSGAQKNGKRKRGKPKTQKPKMTKEERRAKYTKLAHDRRDRKIAAARGRNLVCFRCRKRGHAAADCKADLGGGDGTRGDAAAHGLGGRICYKCGSTEHGLSYCPQLKNAPKLPSGKIDYSKLNLPHAKCYICGHMGHLASSCEGNEGRGIFIKGGACHICGSVQHIAANCPEGEGNKKKSDSEEVESNSEDNGALVDDLLEDVCDGGGKNGEAAQTQKASAAEKEKAKKWKKKVVNF